MLIALGKGLGLHGQWRLPGVYERKGRGCYLQLGHVDADQEDELGDKEVDAEVLMDGVAVTLQAAEEAEGDGADGQAEQGDGDAHTRHDGQKELLHPVPVLGGGEIKVWREGPSVGRQGR